jgi:hypothetical protein
MSEPASVARTSYRVADALLTPHQGRALIKEVRAHACDSGCTDKHSHLDFDEALGGVMEWLIWLKPDLRGKSPAYVRKSGGAGHRALAARWRAGSVQARAGWRGARKGQAATAG